MYKNKIKIYYNIYYIAKSKVSISIIPVYSPSFNLIYIFLIWDILGLYVYNLLFTYSKKIFKNFYYFYLYIQISIFHKYLIIQLIKICKFKLVIIST